MGDKLSLQIKSRVGGPNRPQHIRINGPEGPREALLRIHRGSPQEHARLKAESRGPHPTALL